MFLRLRYRKTLSIASLIAVGFSLFWLPTITWGKYGRDLIWPTPNPAFLEHKEPEAYLQATASGRIESGDWGCSRNGGSKFHEGIDLKSIEKDPSGSVVDPVGAISCGVIAHVNRETSDSNYGKYVVVSHTDMGLEWFSLYAHMGSIAEDIHPGLHISAGHNLGVMGNSSSSIQIPKSRSHLHLEIGLRLNSKFNIWYSQQDFKTENAHGSWNGMNLQGVNPLDFYEYFIDAPDEPFYSYFLKEPVSFEVLVYFEHRPDFLYRNPIFLRGKAAPTTASWYRIGFTWYGLPVDWTPIESNRADKRLNPETIVISDLKYESSCRNWANETPEGFEPTLLLRKQISLLKAEG